MTIPTTVLLDVSGQPAMAQAVASVTGARAVITKPSTPSGLIEGLREARAQVGRGESLIIHGALPQHRFSEGEQREVARLLDAIGTRGSLVAVAPTFPLDVTEAEVLRHEFVPSIGASSAPSVSWGAPDVVG